jgi:hypothetical protein
VVEGGDVAVPEVFKLSRIELDVEVLRSTRTRPGVVLPHLVDAAQRLPAHDDPLEVGCKQRGCVLSIVVDQDLAPPANDLHVIHAHASDFTPEAETGRSPYLVAFSGKAGHQTLFVLRHAATRRRSADSRSG